MSPKNNEKVFTYVGEISLQDFSIELGIKSIEIIKFFFLKGIHTTLNTAFKEEECEALCKEFKYKFQKNIKVQTEEEIESAACPNYQVCQKLLSFEDDLDALIPTAPIITIMGHVDHGKTTLLDQIKKTNLATKEFGNITQHIGAYQIEYKKQFITFLDTPGHKAFTKMRKMGGQVANIVIIVISAIDGIQPQTIEAIQHAMLAKVKIIIFVNKIDKGDHELPVIKKGLSDHGIVIEEFGGDVMFLTGSAIKNQGIDELFEAILLLVELEKYVTTLKNPVIGSIIETDVEKGVGNTATIITHRGKLKVGDFLVTPTTFCKVKNIVDENKKSWNELMPSKPAKISGFKEIPRVGEKFISYSDESTAKKEFEKIIKSKPVKLFDFSHDKTSETLSVLVKADVSGTLEAIKYLLTNMTIKSHGFSVGPVNESDIQLASITNSYIINFNQKVANNIESIAKSSKVSIKNFKSIYHLEDEVAKLKEGYVVVEKIEKILGSANVVKIWHHSKVGTIAGSIVQTGKINIKNKVKVIRNDEVLFTGNIKTFKTELFEIKEAKEKQECGIVVANWNDIKEGDVIQAFEIVNKEP